MELTTKVWKEFSIIKLFDTIQRGKRLKKDDHIEGSIPYSSSTALNNGIDTFIGNDKNVRIFKNCLTLANSGSVGSTFFQPFNVVASDHVTMLGNVDFNKYVYLFLAKMVSRLNEKYSFNREINDTRIKKEKILLPINSLGKPDYVFIENYMKQMENELFEKYKKHISFKKNNEKKLVMKLSNRDWKAFFIEDIFKIKSGKRLTKADMVSGDIPFIGATDSNNGITEFIANKNSSFDSNVLGVNYNGSVVHNFYHSYSAVFSDDVKRLSFKEIEGNKYSFLFVKTLILQQKSKYEYGYKFNGERMKRQKILLPINSKGKPDYDFMENYMKELENEKLNQFLEHKKSKIYDRE